VLHSEGIDHSLLNAIELMVNYFETKLPEAQHIIYYMWVMHDVCISSLVFGLQSASCFILTVILSCLYYGIYDRTGKSHV
jgi:hypothetical protein